MEFIPRAQAHQLTPASEVRTGNDPHLEHEHVVVGIERALDASASDVDSGCVRFGGEDHEDEASDARESDEGEQNAQDDEGPASAVVTMNRARCCRYSTKVHTVQQAGHSRGCACGCPHSHELTLASGISGAMNRNSR